MHEPDLGPMRDSLTGFLNAWLGGPRDWFEARPGACIMSAHARFSITAETARQWNDAMSRSLGDSGIDPDWRGQIEQAFGRMSQGMTRA
jgi:hemoglobin